MRRVWLSTLVLAVCALAVGFVLTESSRVAAEGQAAGSSGVKIRASEQMTGMVSSMLYLPVVDGGSVAVATAVSAEEGGNLSTRLGAFETTIDIPPGAIRENATLVVQVATAPPSPGNLQLVGDVLDIKLHTETGVSITEFLKPFTLHFAAETATERYVDRRAHQMAALADQPEDAVAQVADKEDAYAHYLRSNEYQAARWEADTWTAAFFWPIPQATQPPCLPPHRKRCRQRAKADFNNIQLCSKRCSALPATSSSSTGHFTSQRSSTGQKAASI
jgi:hypothetical protein